MAHISARRLYDVSLRNDTSGRRPLPANDRFPKTKQRQRKLVRIPRERFPWKRVENYRVSSHGGKRVAGKQAPWLISGGFRHMTSDWTSGETLLCWLARTDLEMLERKITHEISILSATQLWEEILRCLSYALREKRYKSSYWDGILLKVTPSYLIAYSFIANI